MESGSAKVADDSVAWDAFEVGEIACFADEESKLSAFGGEGFSYVMADEAGGAGKECTHSS